MDSEVHLEAQIIQNHIVLEIIHAAAHVVALAPGIHVLCQAVNNTLSLLEVLRRLHLLALLHEDLRLIQGFFGDFAGALGVLHNLVLKDREIQCQSQSHKVVGLEAALRHIVALVVGF